MHSVFVCWYADKTTITVPPVNQTVMRGKDVTLHCSAKTDSMEHRHLKISWMLDGELIKFGQRTNVAQYDPDKSLKITQAQIENTGSYTCNASTELDWAAVTVRLTVRGITFDFLTFTVLNKIVFKITYLLTYLLFKMLFDHCPYDSSHSTHLGLPAPSPPLSPSITPTLFHSKLKVKVARWLTGRASD